MTFQAAVSFRLGVASDPLPGHERFADMLCIPYLTAAGPVKLKFRCLQNHSCKEVGHPKYDGPSSPVRLYNVAALQTSGDTVAVCEGELDALIMTHEVGVPAVATAAGTWQDHWTRALADYDNVLVFVDDDEAGMRHGKSLVKLLDGKARMIVPPAGMDVSEWFLAEGRGPLREAAGL